VLIFFRSTQSGPARRMESSIAHLARKERERLTVTVVDVDEKPELGDRFRIDVVPTLVLVKGKRVVARLEDRRDARRASRARGHHDRGLGGGRTEASLEPGDHVQPERGRLDAVHHAVVERDRDVADRPCDDRAVAGDW
jgi:Thioredoxin